MTPADAERAAITQDLARWQNSPTPPISIQWAKHGARTIVVAWIAWHSTGARFIAPALKPYVRVSNRKVGFNQIKRPAIKLS
jgi:hypothetical protein